MTGQRPGAAIGYDAPEADIQTQEVLRLFEAKAMTWAAKYGPGGPLAGRLGRLSAAVGRYAGPGDRVLDLGCGTGELARALDAAGFRVTGCDISRQMLMRAARGPGRAQWVLLEPGWRSLPFAPGTFGVVVAASVLEYVGEPTAVLRECARVLRPGGVVLYTVPDLRHPVRWVEWAARRLTSRAPGSGRRPRRRRDGHWTRLDGYRAYLHASRQRHAVRWWRAASGRAGLRPLPCPAAGGRTALRLLAFRRAGAQAPGAEAGP